MIRQRVRTAVASRLASAPPQTSTGYLVGLIGRAIGLSRTPTMHEREGARMGIPYVYLLLDFDQLGLDDAQLPEVIAEVEELGFAGLNVTHPFKQTIIGHLHDLSPEATAIGAVNTVLLGGGRRVGHNTDSWGFAESFCEELSGVPLGFVVQFGAGGAGAAVAHALLSQDVGQLRLYDIQKAKADMLALRLRERFGPRVAAIDAIGGLLSDTDGIVNATPTGMIKYPGLPFARDLLEPRHWVAEIVYFPPDTELLRLARSLGCRTLAGTGMAVNQAVKAFELFTGQAPDRSRMIDHFKAAA